MARSELNLYGLHLLQALLLSLQLGVAMLHVSFISEASCISMFLQHALSNALNFCCHKC